MSPTHRSDCVFCDRAKIKAETVEEMHGADGSLHWVFEPLQPVVTGHLLVVPAQHVQDATEEPLVTSMAAGVAARVAARYRSANIITSIGVPATQSVMHLHLHVVPRKDGDGLSLPWTPDHMTDLSVRIDRALRHMDLLVKDVGHGTDEHKRLKAKAEGVALVGAYVDEYLRERR